MLAGPKGRGHILSALNECSKPVCKKVERDAQSTLLRGHLKTMKLYEKEKKREKDIKGRKASFNVKAWETVTETYLGKLSHFENKTLS